MGRVLHDWTAIQAYHDDGHGFVECSKKFGFSHTAWTKAIKRGRLQARLTLFTDRRRKYDWAKVQAYYDEGHTYLQCAAHFGFCSEAWDGAVKRGDIQARRRGRSLERVLQSRSSRWCKKLKLLREGILTNQCERCRISNWRGKRLAIHIDHINGKKNDWRLENLRMLCPNCHSQTPNSAAEIFDALVLSFLTTRPHETKRRWAPTL
jgi:5-methylcytosine-specific restriction endonuclease McrA